MWIRDTLLPTVLGVEPGKEMELRVVATDRPVEKNRNGERGSKEDDDPGSQGLRAQRNAGRSPVKHGDSGIHFATPRYLNDRRMELDNSATARRRVPVLHSSAGCYLTSY